ncbi:hypothetical protein [uncultured Microbulbifer sp.]|uniref:hypothetical protein n=1 Tax=uncultured Microbulbifer sp. TaxID=348147 RepID=UPI002612E609|nr:hypothetical protein [uncultured Microbulbifer sp.]
MNFYRLMDWPPPASVQDRLQIPFEPLYHWQYSTLVDDAFQNPKTQNTPKVICPGGQYLPARHFASGTADAAICVAEEKSDTFAPEVICALPFLRAFKSIKIQKAGSLLRLPFVLDASLVSATKILNNKH